MTHLRLIYTNPNPASRSSLKLVGKGGEIIPLDLPASPFITLDHLKSNFIGLECSNKKSRRPEGGSFKGKMR